MTDEPKPDPDPFRPVRLALLGAMVCSGLAFLLTLYVALTGHG